MKTYFGLPAFWPSCCFDSVYETRGEREWKEQIPYTKRILTANHSAWVDLLTMKESSKFLDIHSGFCHLVKVTIVIILR